PTRLHSFPTRRSSDLADAQWMNVEAWGIAVLGFRLARWGSPALHPRLSKSAVSPLNAIYDCHTLDSCQSCQRAWEVKVSDRRLRSEEHTSELQSRENL